LNIVCMSRIVHLIKGDERYYIAQAGVWRVEAFPRRFCCASAVDFRREGTQLCQKTCLSTFQTTHICTCTIALNMALRQSEDEEAEEIESTLATLQVTDIWTKLKLALNARDMPTDYRVRMLARSYHRVVLKQGKF